MYYGNSSYYHDYLIHHGVKGQKWGVRRYQRKDGTYTNAGRKRLARQAGRKAAEESWANSKASPDSHKLGSGRRAMNASASARRKAEYESLRSTRAHNKQIRADKRQERANAKELERKFKESDPSIVKVKSKKSADGSGYNIVVYKKVDKNSPEAVEQLEQRKATAKKVAKGAAFVAGTALAAYGVSKLVKNQNSKVQIKKGEDAVRKYRDSRMVTGIDGSARWNFVTIKNKSGSETFKGTRDIGRVLDTYDATTKETSKKIMSKAREEAARQVTTREAARNVADYYIRKRR